MDSEGRSPRAVVTTDLVRVPLLAPIFGRAFTSEPMMVWPMGPGGGLAERFTRCFSYFLEEALPLGVVWEAGDAEGVEAAGVAVWIAPEHRGSWENNPWDQQRILAVADDGGRRYEEFWDWVAEHEPTEPAWQLDTVAVAPELQGRGIGRALIEVGLARATAEGKGAFLSTGTPDNVGIYSRCGFRVYDQADAPGGGPHIWFMRRDP